MASSHAVLFELPSMFQVDAVVGQGAYGTVCRATVHAPGVDKPIVVAIKKIPGFSRSADTSKRVLRELIILEQFATVDQIVSAHMFFRPVSQANDIYVVMDYVPSDVSTFLKQSPPENIQPAVVQYMIAQLLLGLRGMHKGDCTHRDLSTRNVLLTEQAKIQIADFGLARFFDPEERMSFGVVTQWYRAPEVITDAQYGPKVDVWSVGVIMAELLMQGHLFPGKPNDLADQLNKIMRILGVPNVEWFQDPQSILSSSSDNAKRYVQRAAASSRPFKRTLFTPEGPTFRVDMTDDTKELLSSLLTFNPVDRPDAEAALRHRYFDNLRSYIDGSIAEQDSNFDPDALAAAVERLQACGPQNDGTTAKSEIEEMAPVWNRELEQQATELFQELAQEPADE